MMAEDFFLAVQDFHLAFDIPVRTYPTVDHSDVVLRIDLLSEEFQEYVTAARQGDIVEVADGLADMVYIIFGTALAYGIDLPVVLAEVHRSNMTKLGSDGRPVVRADGKVLKGPNFSPPDIKRILDAYASKRPPVDNPDYVR